MRASVLEQQFLRVSDVQVGELLKGIVKKLTEGALFVSISGSVDGVVFPNHYADIMLKHPQKRFKEGANIKCRVSPHAPGSPMASSTLCSLGSCCRSREKEGRPDSQEDSC